MVLYQKICLKEGEVWRKVVSNKITVTLVTHTRFAVFFPLPSRCVSSILGKLIFSGFKSRDSGIGAQGNLHQCCDGSYSGMERISAKDDEEFLILLAVMK